MKRIRTFLQKQGFFLMLALCLCVIAASALWTKRQALQAEQVGADAQGVQSLADAQRMRLNTAPVDGACAVPFGESIWLQTLGCFGAHEAVDITAPRGAPVLAAAAGEVTRAYRDRAWGGVVEIAHQDGLTTRYLALETPLNVRVGERVEAGQAIGTVGMAALESETGAHLHFETLLDGKPVNPAHCLP